MYHRLDEDWGSGNSSVLAGVAELVKKCEYIKAMFIQDVQTIS